MSLKSVLRELKLEKALLFDTIESMLFVSAECYEKFGKIEVEIIKIQKEISREVKNDFE